MDENLADQLVIAATRLQMTTDHLGHDGITTDDLASVADYLWALTDHAHQTTSLALHAIDNPEPGHPIYSTSVRTALFHARALLDTAMHFAAEAEQGTHVVRHEPE